MTAKRYSDLIVWQKAMNLVETVYKITRAFPKEETYGLTGQLRRAAVSVPSNIAEGHSRTGRREFAHFLSMAHGSLSEVETQIEIAHRLGYMTDEEREKVVQNSSEVGRIVVGLIDHWRSMLQRTRVKFYGRALTSDACPLTPERKPR